MKVVRLFSYFLLVIISTSLVSADSIEDKINSIVKYAEQYEVGQINYLQVQVHANSIREDINEMLGEEFETGFEKGLTQESVQKLFGKPIENTKWVWSVGEEKEVKLDEPMPRWEKIVFDGKKIQVTFNAHPQVIKKDGGLIKFYWVDFDTRFKKKFDFDMNEMINVIKSLGENYLKTQSGGTEFAAKMIEYRSVLQGYLEQNRENCKYIIEQFFGEDEKVAEQERIRWGVPLYKGDKIELMLEINMCDGCEWPWIDFWFDLRSVSHVLKFKDDNAELKKLDRKQYEEMSIDELNGKIGDIINEIVSAAKEYDKAESGDFPAKLGAARAEIQLMNNVLDSKYYDNEGARQENFEKRKTAVREMLSQYEEPEIEPIKEIRYERKLVEDKVENTFKQCRNFGDKKCNDDEGCYKGECVYAAGGDEICNNNADDDSDNIIDCADPDCARDCHKICKKVCEKDCWPCNDRECRDVCKDCWGKCGPGEDCESFCRECWDCTDQKCWSTSVCNECKTCEDEQYKCFEECKPCEKCKKDIGGDACGTVCEGCYNCKAGGEQKECMDYCNGMKEEDVRLDIVERCMDLCMQNVVFICQDGPSKVPCSGVEYLCEGKDFRNIPCMIYDCEGVKQSLPCGQGIMCGINMVGEGTECVCEKGFYDCDGDGKNCESDAPCEEFKEVCDDNEDNDADHLLDCEDLADCTSSVCGKDENGNDLFCFDGKCTSAVTAVCDDGICSENENCPQDCEISLRKGYGEDCEFDAECMTGQCIAGKCSLNNATGEQCTENWQCESGLCLDGVCAGRPAEELCGDGRCDEAELRAGQQPCAADCECDTTEDCIEGELCNEYHQCVPSDTACVVNEDCAEGELCVEGDCETEFVLEPTGESCVIREDCSGENDICSNGICKRIPAEAVEEEEVVEIPVEMPAVEEPAEETVPETEEPAIEEEESIVEEEEAAEETGESTESEERISDEEQEEREEVEEEPDNDFSLSIGIGNAISMFAGCKTDEDCGENRGCDRAIGNCHCKEFYFDCNGQREGEDEDGCESQDPTCGGKREICQGGCHESQYCNEKRGYCECKDGYYECDGDWMNGCESKEKCKQCETDADCAPDRCAEWDGGVVQDFGCYEGETWIEEKGTVAFSGGCNYHPTGQVDPYLEFHAWGEQFSEIEMLKSQLEKQQGEQWCKWRLENMKKERQELEQSFNQQFLKWFFEEYVTAEPENWDKHIGGIFKTYWEFVDNSRETHNMLGCTGIEEWPSEYKPIELEYESEFGHVKFWEEMKELDGRAILTPYMQIWIFPPEEIIKQEFLKAGKEGFLPGPPEERKGREGPTPNEIKEMRENSEIMEIINDYSESFGGSADFLITIDDNGEGIYSAVLTINPDVLMEVKPAKQFAGEPDVSVTIDFKFLYSIISSVEKGMQTESPPWDNKPRMKEGFKGVVDKAAMASKVIGAFTTGNIKVKPITALPKVVKIIKLMFEQGPPSE